MAKNHRQAADFSCRCFSKYEFGSQGSGCCCGLAPGVGAAATAVAGLLLESEGDPPLLFLLSCLFGLISQVDMML